MSDSGLIAATRGWSGRTRRSVVAAFAGAVLSQARTNARAARSGRPMLEIRAVPFEPLVYRDGVGRPLGLIRPYAVFEDAAAAADGPLDGRRGLALRVGVRSFGLAAFSVDPAWFALRDADLRLHRPLSTAAVTSNNDGADEPFTGDPIPPCGRRDGWLRYRVPIAARLEALVLTPSPGPAFLLADLRQTAPVVID